MNPNPEAEAAAMSLRSGRYRVRSEDLRSLTVRLPDDVEAATETDEASDSEGRIVAALEHAALRFARLSGGLHP